MFENWVCKIRNKYSFSNSSDSGRKDVTQYGSGEITYTKILAHIFDSDINNTDIHTHILGHAYRHASIFRRFESRCVFEFFNKFSCRLTIKEYTSNAEINVTNRLYLFGNYIQISYFFCIFVHDLASTLELRKILK